MHNSKLNFMGLIANVDSSILKVKLDHGFKIKSHDITEGFRLISHLNSFSFLPDIPQHLMQEKLSRFKCSNLDEGKIYSIENSFSLSGDCSFENIDDIDEKFFNNYLSSVMQLMRLYKFGNICIPFKYYYVYKDSENSIAMSNQTLQYVSKELYSLNESEISRLNIFLQDIKFLFEKEFLNFALENFELSYQTQSIKLSFLSLMTSMESLFNLSQAELSYTISRNTAVLLGTNKAESIEIFQEMKKLYRKRSKIIHGNSSINIDEDDLLNLRNYVRESIKQIYNLGMDKKEVLALLNSLGFGSSPIVTK